MTYPFNYLARLGLDELAIRIRCWRRKHRLTQGEFAALAGVSKQLVHRFEVGRMRRPWPSTRAKLVHAMSTWDETKRPVRKPEARGGARCAT